MKNINRFLENSVRSDVIGYNIYTMGCDLNATHRRIPHERKFGYMPASNWDMPSFGLPGLISIGHHLDISDLLTLSIVEDDKQINFDVARNHWTPAYMKTIYRSTVDANYYPYAGCLCVLEEKCFLPDDTFIANVKICNDKREDCTLTIELKLPLERLDEGKYIIDAKTTAKCLRKQYTVSGFIAACTNEGKDCFKVTIPAGGEVTFSYGFAFDTDSFEAASSRLQNAFNTKNPLEIKEKYFNEWMKNNIPQLSTDNTDMLKIYYYRAFVIYRTVHAPDKIIKNHDFKGECVYESPFGTWFGAPVGLSVPLQIEEMKWLRSPDAVRSHISNWTNGAGNTADYIQFTPWAIWRLYQHHPDKEFLSLCYDACKAFSIKDYDTSNPEKLPLQVGSWSTGAEYQPAFYQYTSPPWDWRYDNEGARDFGFKKATLYRVECCVMLAANLKACSEMAQILGIEDEAKKFKSCFNSVKKQIIKHFWNEKEQFFFDCEPKELKHCNLAAGYDGFTPMMWDLVGEGFDSAFAMLLDKKHFNTNFPTPTISKSCPMYWFDNCIAGPCQSSLKEPKTYGCSWNGPTWPFANTLVLEALGSAAKRNTKLQGLFLDYFGRYTELHFLYGDRSVPVIVEHYRPTDGAPFSVFNEYFHSEWLTLFMEYYAGISVKNGEVTFAPITDDEFILEDVKIAGKSYNFKQYTQKGVLKKSVEIN